MPRILIVEDNADLAAGIEYNLGLEGYETRIADDGRRALTVAAEWTPDVILLDLMLPELDGYQVLQALRGRGESMGSDSIDSLISMESDPLISRSARP